MVTVRRRFQYQFLPRVVLLAGLLLVLAFAWGCGGHLPQERETEIIFFPLPPDPPRIQYLTSFRTAKDVGEAPSSFQSFILGKEAENHKGINKPFGLAFHDGVIYVADIRQRAILTLNLKDHRFDFFHATGRGSLRKPVSIFIDSDGTKYVSDVDRRQVVVFKPDDSFKMALGDGKVIKPTDVAVSDNRVFVSDIDGHQVQVFDKETGKALFNFGALGSGEGQFNNPDHVAVDAAGNVYVSDLINSRVQKFDPDGKFLSVIGKAGDTIGSFSRPKGVAVDRDGRVYVVDAGFENIQVFNPAGQLLMFFGGSGNLPGHMYLPAKVIVDYDNVPYFQRYVDKDFKVEYLLLVTNQFGDFPVSVYGFGSLKK